MTTGFAPIRERSEPLPPERGAWLRWVLFSAGCAAAVACMRPWVRVRFERLFGELLGPPAWQSTAGFTCLCASALVLVMTLAETRSHHTRAAVRPANLALVSVTLLALLLHWWRGPGMLRGVSAAWTWAFYVSLVAVPLLWVACVGRAQKRITPSR